MARYVHEGVEVLVVSCTGGERGDVLNPTLAADEAFMTDFANDVASSGAARWRTPRTSSGSSTPGSASSTRAFPRATRRRRCPRAASRWCRSRRPAEPLVELVREFRPHVMTTYDENGGYPHPDHVKCHEVSVEAFEAAGDPDRYPGTGEPWQPLKLYYHQTFHKLARRRAARRARCRPAIESPYGEWLESWEDDPEHAKRLTTFVDAARVVPRARPGSEGARLAGRPRRSLVRSADRAAAVGVADRGLRARQVAGPDTSCPRTTSSPGCATLVRTP